MALTLITCVLLACGILAFPRYRAVPAARDGESAADGIPTVSIIIPARNEEKNLPALLDSLRAQQIRVLEILVIDDESTDRTAEVARSMGARVVPAGPLPEGWLGKANACHQGALAARGDWLLFLDADTWFEPSGLDRLLAFFAKTGGALSLIPWHVVRAPHEHLSVFFNINAMAGTGAFTPWPGLRASLSGPVLLVGRADYLASGGYEKVKSRILENFQLTRAFRDHGMGITVLGGRGIISYRMYPESARHLATGWMKGFANGAASTPRPVLILLVLWMTGLVCAAQGLALAPTTGLAWGLYALAVVQCLVFFARVGSFRWWSAVIYPVFLIFFFVLFGISASRAARGKSVQWKGRAIHAD